MYNFCHYISVFYDYLINKNIKPEKINGCYYFLNIPKNSMEARVYIYSGRNIKTYLKKKYNDTFYILDSIEKNKTTLVPFTSQISTFLKENNITINYNLPFGLLF